MRHVFLFAFCIVCCMSFAEDTITLKENELLIGTVTSFTPKEVKVLVGDTERSISMSDVVDVKLKRSDNTRLHAELKAAKKRIGTLTAALEASGVRVPQADKHKRPDPSEFITISDLRTMVKKTAKLTTSAQKKAMMKECLKEKSKIKLTNMKVISVKSGNHRYHIRMEGTVTPGIPIKSPKTHITADLMTSGVAALKLNKGDKLNIEGTFKKLNLALPLDPSDKSSRIYFSLGDPCQISR